jgi:hypothetical protein
MVNGTFNEAIMSAFLLNLVFPDIRANFDKQVLLGIVKEFRPNRLENVASKIPNFRGWPSTNVKKIIDYVYGLDYIIQVDPTGERVGIDFTLNAESIEEKVEKAKSFAPLWRALGVSKVVVLLTTYPDGNDQGLAFYKLEEAQDAIENIIYNAIEGTEEVTTATVNVTS